MWMRLGLGILLALSLSLASTSHAWARKMRVVESMPASDAYIDGRNAQYTVRFDGPVDHDHAHLWIVHNGRVVSRLPVLKDSAPDVLFASAPQLAKGHYQLHWSVGSAPDKEVTKGSLKFTVKP
jgi:methionine-rich copper-binding protein CopC